MYYLNFAPKLGLIAEKLRSVGNSPSPGLHERQRSRPREVFSRLHLRPPSSQGGGGSFLFVCPLATSGREGRREKFQFRLPSLVRRGQGGGRKSQGTNPLESPLTKGSCEEIRFDVGASRLLTRAVLTGNDLQYRDRKEAGRSSISSQLQGTPVKRNQFLSHLPAVEGKV